MDQLLPGSFTSDLERKAAHVIGRARGRHCSGSESIARLGKIWCKRGAVRLSQSRYASGDRGKERHHAQQTLLNGEDRSEEHTSELQSLMRISYAVFCLKKKKK